MFKKERIRRAPLIKDGKPAGIILQGDLPNTSPSPVTTLSLEEMNYLLSKVNVKRGISKKVITVDRYTHGRARTHHAR